MTTECPRQTTRYCKECGHKLRIYRHECEMLCDGCMTAWPMPRACFNDLKRMASEFSATEDEFAKSVILPNMARRAYRAAKKDKG